jgi:hypothetical protein
LTLKEFKKLLEAFEADGRQAMGIHLPADTAAVLRKELHHLYGFDPGEGLTTLFGLEVLSTDAPEIRFEE